MRVRKKGPFVRMNRYEIHITDPDFCKDLYVGGGGSKGKSDKWYWVHEDVWWP